MRCWQCKDPPHTRDELVIEDVAERAVTEIVHEAWKIARKR